MWWSTCHCKGKIRSSCCWCCRLCGHVFLIIALLFIRIFLLVIVVSFSHCFCFNCVRNNCRDMSFLSSSTTWRFPCPFMSPRMSIWIAICGGCWIIGVMIPLLGWLIKIVTWVFWAWESASFDELPLIPAYGTVRSPEFSLRRFDCPFASNFGWEGPHPWGNKPQWSNPCESNWKSVEYRCATQATSSRFLPNSPLSSERLGRWKWLIVGLAVDHDEGNSFPYSIPLDSILKFVGKYFRDLQRRLLQKKQVHRIFVLQIRGVLRLILGRAMYG